MAEKIVEIKVVRGYSLTRANVEWLRARALAMSTVENRLSDSLFLDNLITRERARPSTAARGIASAQGEGGKGKVTR